MKKQVHDNSFPDPYEDNLIRPGRPHQKYKIQLKLKERRREQMRLANLKARQLRKMEKFSGKKSNN